MRRHFDPTLQMLADLIAVCSGSLWDASREGEVPFGQQIIHVLTGIEFWLCGTEGPFAAQDLRIDPTANSSSHPGRRVSKAMVDGYLVVVAQEVQTFFRRMDDSSLAKPSRAYPNFTHADLLLMQIRHIQHHIGACNRMLRENGIPPVQWRGFGE